MESREREGTRHNIEDARERLSELAGELGRRVNPDYLRGRAREAIVKRSYEVKDRTMDSPLALGLLGGLLSAGIGSFMRRRRHRQDFSDVGYGYGGQRLGGYDRYGDDGRYGAGYGGGMGESYDQMGTEGSSRGMYAGSTYGRTGGDVGESYAGGGITGGKQPPYVSSGVGTSYIGGQENVGGSYSGQTGYGTSGDNVGTSYGTSGENVGTSYGATGAEVGGAGEGGIKDKVVGKAHEVKDKAAGVVSSVGAKASDIKERAVEKVHGAREHGGERFGGMRERAHNVREHIPSMHDMRYRSSEFIHTQVETQPFRLALGALAAGAALGFLIPVMQRERETLAPVKHKARERLDEVGRDLQGRIEGKLDDVEQKLGSAKTATGGDQQQDPRHNVM